MEKNTVCVSPRFHCKNPARIPNVVETIRKFCRGAVQELACLRQLSQLYFETLSSTYFDELNKSITIEPRVEDNGNPSRRLDELPYIYRRIIVKNPNIVGFDLVPTSILPYITSIELSLCKHEIYLNDHYRRDTPSIAPQEEASIKFAIQLCEKFLSKLTNLKILDIMYAASYGGLFKSTLTLLSTQLPTIQINLHIQYAALRFIHMFIEQFKLSTPTNLSLRIGTLDLRGNFDSDLFRPIRPSLQEWIDMTQSRIEAIFTFGCELKHEIEFLYDLMAIWKSTTLSYTSIAHTTYPCPLSHQVMRQQISKLHLIHYLRQLDFIRDMPKLKILILEHIDIYACLFSDIELTFRDNLKVIFEGMKNLDVKLVRSSDKPGYDKITPGNHVAEYIGTLVREFEVI